MTQPKAEWRVLVKDFDSIMWTFTGWLVNDKGAATVHVPDPKHEWEAAREACGLGRLKV